MKVAIDIDSQKIDWALKVIRNDLLPSEEDYGPESMQGGHGEALTIAVAVLEAVRKDMLPPDTMRLVKRADGESMLIEFVAPTARATP
jgi:hypothetical protein